MPDRNEPAGSGELASPRPFVDRINGLLAGGFVAVVGLYLLYKCGSYALATYHAQTWPAMEATVTEASLSERIIDDRGDDGEVLRTEVFTDVQVTARYTVNGKDFESSHTKTFGDGSAALAEHYRSGFPPGKRIEIIYNPSSPLEIFLERPENRDYWFTGIGAVLSLAITVAGVWYFLRSW